MYLEKPASMDVASTIPYLPNIYTLYLTYTAHFTGAIEGKIVHIFHLLTPSPPYRDAGLLHLKYLCLPSRSLARACGARLMEYMLRKMREAHFPQHILHHLIC